MGFKIGMLGAGHMAQRMADTIKNMEQAEVYAVAARDLERAKSFAEQFDAPKAYGSYEELMEDEQVDLIYIATPNHLHYTHAMECLKHKKPVLMEKPFTLNQNQARTLMDYAQMHGVFLAEALWVRYMPLMKHLKKDLEAGVIGEVTAVTCNLGYDLREKERVLKLELGGGALLDLGVYPISFVLQILGEGIEKMSTNMVRLSTGVDAQEFVNFTYESGAVAGMYITMLSNTDRKGMIYGTEGYIQVENINNYESYTVYNAQHEKVSETVRPEQISGLEYEVEACMRAIALGKVECEEMKHSDTLFLMSILDQLRAAWGLHFPQEERV